MSFSNSKLAFGDCYALLDDALAAKKGLRIRYASEGVAGYQRQRFNHARVLDRNNNLKVYTEGHDLYGRSVYDTLSIRKRVDDEGNWYIIIVKVEAAVEVLGVDELTDEDETLLKLPEQPAKIEVEVVPYEPPKIRRI